MEFRGDNIQFGIRQSGFTMIELLIYLALIGVVSIFLGSAFVSLSRSEAQVEVKNDVQSNVRFALRKIEQDLHAATAIATPASAGNSGSVLDMTVGGTEVSYCVAGGQLRRSSGGACSGSSPIVTTASVSVSSVTFTRAANTNGVLSKTYTSIGVTISANYNSTSSDRQYTYSKQTTILLY